MNARKLLSAAKAVEAAYIEDVFSTYLYTGTGAGVELQINNGIDLSTKGGLVWCKNRGASQEHWFFDTDRGMTYSVARSLDSASTASQVSQGSNFIKADATGFTLGTDAGATSPKINGNTYVGWTFRKQAKFFDVVTYTGDGVAGRTVAHNLGSVPGFIVVKKTNASGTNWNCYHRSLGATQVVNLNTTAAATTVSTVWNNTAPTSTEFTVGTGSAVNSNGDSFVAYLFAHDAGGFGASGSDNVISCGSFTGPSATITLGYEPQFVLLKASGTTSNWAIYDVMRGMPVSGAALELYPNLANAEGSGGVVGSLSPTATGFSVTGAFSSTVIYIAIRRGPMKTPTTGTSVFSPTLATFSGTTVTNTGFVVDMAINKNGVASVGNNFVLDRLRGSDNSTNQQTISTNTTSAEVASSGRVALTGSVTIQNGFLEQNITANNIVWAFRRAPGFFDVVCYTGTGANRTVSHNLGVVPEMMIVKNRSDATGRAWAVYAGDATDYLVLNTTAATVDDIAHWNDTSPTSSVFTVGTSNSTNESSDTFVAYLFATCPGVSKVFSYTGNGSSQTINCGFTGGARFVLIKRTDSTGDWYVWDSARGIVAGNDPHLSLNSAAAEVTTDDSVDTDSTGFVVNELAATNVNVNAATYIGLAIA